eukprot:5966963-Pleurochrysis_carterae.AAC.1
MARCSRERMLVRHRARDDSKASREEKGVGALEQSEASTVCAAAKRWRGQPAIGSHVKATLKEGTRAWKSKARKELDGKMFKP